MSIVRLLILGALRRRGTAHGYRIHRDFIEWRVDTWTSVRPGSIYHALAQMEKLGLIAQTATATDQKQGPAKTEYHLTPQGQQSFVELLQTALTDINLIELSVGIAFMEYLSRAEVLALLQQRLAAQQDIASHLAALPVEPHPRTPATHPELLRVWSATYADAAASTQALINAIQSGAYVFKNEGDINENHTSHTT
jgi:DNA-binding PadR family transcriptional regulator